MIDRAAAALERLVLAVMWLLVAAAIAFGAAGVATALDHWPGTPTRPELTWAGDSRVAATLDAATIELAAIAGLVDELGVQGRGSLAALAARDFELLETTTATGRSHVLAIRERSTALRDRLEGLGGFGQTATFVYSADTRERRATILEALELTDELAVSWARLTSGGLAAAGLVDLLTAHDQQIAAAIDSGRGGAFDEAIAGIDAATAALDEAQRLRDQLANNVDVDTLDQWLLRNREYDVALKALYVASAESPSRITNAIREAVRAERAARDRLPRTTSGLTIVMADIAQGGINQAIIAIEEARGALAATLAELEEGSEPAS